MGLEPQKTPTRVTRVSRSQQKDMLKLPDAAAGIRSTPAAQRLAVRLFCLSGIWRHRKV